MEQIRAARVEDASRIAEILIFTKRMHYRDIFHNDEVSFGVLQVLPQAMEYINEPEKLKGIYVYDDAFVKGMIHVEGDEIKELYVDSFFHGEGVGGRLMEYAKAVHGAKWLWVLEKNAPSIRFYEHHGFRKTEEKKLQPGTPEYLVKMALPA